MTELIIRMTDTSEDVTILKNDLLKDIQVEKQLSVQAFHNKLTDLIETSQTNFTPTFFEPSVVGYDKHNNHELFIINQPEHKRIVTTSFKDNKAYNINFPNSIYFIVFSNNRIQRIYAYAYKEFNGSDTELYEYPMPNQLTGAQICLGGGFRDKRPSIEQTLEFQIYAPYSHSNVTGIKSFKNTTDYFEYLSKNPFPYHLLNKLNKQLKDIQP